MKKNPSRAILIFTAVALVFLFSSLSAISETDPLLEGMMDTIKQPAPLPSPEAEPLQPTLTPSPIPTLASAEVLQPSVSPSPQSPPVPESKKAVLEVDPGIRQSETRLGMEIGPALNSYRLTGSGATIRAPFTSGMYFGAEIVHRTSSGRGFLVRLNETQTDHKNFSSVTPSTVTIEHRRLDAAMLFPLNSNWNMYSGYSARERDATQTSPSTVVSHQRSHGLVLGVELRGDPGSFRTSSKLDFRIPLFLSESGAKTGSHILSSEFEMGSGFQYQLSKAFELGLSIRFRGGFHFFRGTGDRRVTDATERDLTFFLPLEVRFYF